MKRWKTKMLSLVCCGLAALGGNPLSVPAEGKEKDAVTARKEETVYVLSGADGSMEKVIVSGWLQNTSGQEFLEDLCDLENLENMKGEETFTREGDTLVWNAKGNDIYYQGTSGKDLPVEVSVSYMLDGEEIAAAGLAGESGEVTIRFDYACRRREEKVINKEKETLSVPFAMVSGLVLDNKVFSNVQVTGGKTFNDGSRTVAAGMAFPGLQENLALSPEDFQVPSFVEVTAHAENFQLAMTLTMGTNAVFNSPDLEHISSPADLEESLVQMTEGMTRLQEGSDAISAGVSELLASSGELTGGIDSLVKGAEALKEGSVRVDDGAGELKQGLEELSEGLKTLASNNETLLGVAASVFQTLLLQANEQLLAAGLELPALTIETYGDVLDVAAAELEAVGADAGAVIALQGSLDGYGTFYEGLVSYMQGVENSAAGAETLKAGAGSLKAGTGELLLGSGELDQGLLSLQEALPVLQEGIGALQDGSAQLLAGFQEYSQEGIGRFSQAAGGDLNSLTERLKAIQEVSRSYTSFSGAGDGMESEVQFIYRTDSI